MKNPYFILKLKQDVTKQEIIKAKIQAMKDRNYSLQEIQTAEKQLLNPSKRLVADYMFPSKLKSKRPRAITITTEFQEIDLSVVNEDAFDSLK